MFRLKVAHYAAVYFVNKVKDRKLSDLSSLSHPCHTMKELLTYIFDDWKWLDFAEYLEEETDVYEEQIPAKEASYIFLDTLTFQQKYFEKGHELEARDFWFQLNNFESTLAWYGRKEIADLYGEDDNKLNKPLNDKELQDFVKDVMTRWVYTKQPR